MRYGGNTPCIAIRRNGASDNRVVVLDAGTGVRALGRALVADTGGSVTADLLVSHTHWDHIQGLPYFAPLFEDGNTVRVWGAKQNGMDLEAILRDQMRPVVFPVPLDHLSAELEVSHVTPGAFEIDGFTVRAMRVRHPGTTLAYVLEPAGGGARLAYVTDNELSGGVYDVGPDWRAEFVEFLRGVDYLIHDAMFTADELARHAGWGHSSNVEAVTLAAEAEAKQLVLFHHRPEHDDGTIDAILEQSRETAEKMGGGLEVVAAQEGMQLILE
jgi:phosphoribosyl 1,2-cyclic phosphodiesterase